MTSNFKRLKVPEGAADFIVDQLGADVPPDQLYREFTINAVQAIKRRMETGDTRLGEVVWDCDWAYYQATKQHKLTVIDNGDGMSSDELLQNLNSLAVQGANQNRSIDGNKGLGGKVSALSRHPEGIIYESKKVGAALHLMTMARERETGHLGARKLSTQNGDPVYVAEKFSEPHALMSESGTKVTFLGTEPCESTVPKGGASLIKYLNNKFFRTPEGIDIKARRFPAKVEDLPTEEPSAADKTLSYERIKGTDALLRKYANDYGSVLLPESCVVVHWYYFEDEKKTNKNISPRLRPTGHVGVVYQDEVYMVQQRRVLNGFGIYFGHKKVALYVEPQTEHLHVHSDIVRSRLIVNGEDVDHANYWERWGAEFQRHMPEELRDMQNEIRERALQDYSSEKRNRIKLLLAEVVKRFRTPRYRRSPKSDVRAEREVSGGQPRQLNTLRPTPPTKSLARTSKQQYGSATDDYFAHLATEMGVPAVKVTNQIQVPEAYWVSEADKTREPDELVGLGAELQGDSRTSSLLKMNADFQGYRQMIEYFETKYEAQSVPEMKILIQKEIRLWCEFQVLETIIMARNLEDGSTWDRDHLSTVLSSTALTAVMLNRYQIVERVERGLRKQIKNMIDYRSLSIGDAHENVSANEEGTF